MLNTKEKRDEFIKLAEPLIKFLNDNTNPHTTIIISTNHAEVLSGEMAHRTDRFIKD